MSLTFECDGDDSDGGEKTVIPNPIDAIEKFFQREADENKTNTSVAAAWCHALGTVSSSSSVGTAGAHNTVPQPDASEAEWSAFYGPVATVRPRQVLTTISRDSEEAAEEEEDTTKEAMVSAVFKREAEVKEILSIDRRTSDLKQFLRLTPYFDGRYHLEEIMFHENLERAVVTQVLDKYSQVLTAHEHEDPRITQHLTPKK